MLNAHFWSDKCWTEPCSLKALWSRNTSNGSYYVVFLSFFSGRQLVSCGHYHYMALCGFLLTATLLCLIILSFQHVDDVEDALTVFSQEEVQTHPLLPQIPKSLWAKGKNDMGLVNNAGPVIITAKSDYRRCQAQYPLQLEAIDGITPVCDVFLQNQALLFHVKINLFVLLSFHWKRSKTWGNKMNGDFCPGPASFKQNGSAKGTRCPKSFHYSLTVSIFSTVVHCRWCWPTLFSVSLCSLTASSVCFHLPGETVDINSSVSHLPSTICRWCFSLCSHKRTVWSRQSQISEASGCRRP